MGPPLSTAAVVAERVSEGWTGSWSRGGNEPVLGVHWSMVATGGGGNVLRPGHLVVIGTPPDRLEGTPVIEDGRSYAGGGASEAISRAWNFPRIASLPSPDPRA